jgi:hypothetical protein
MLSHPILLLNMTVFPEVFLKKSDNKYDEFELVEDCLVNLPDGEKFVIPKGYNSDFATVPQLFWSMFPAHGLAAMPSIVHDWMYDNRLFEKKMGEKRARKYADDIFLHHMTTAKKPVPKWQRLTYFYVVRTFALPWWRN